MDKISRRKFIAGTTISIAGLGVFGLVGYAQLGKNAKDNADISLLTPDEQIYHKFMKMAAEPGMALPDHEVKAPMFQAMFSAAEAEFLTKFSFLPNTPEKLARKTEMSVDELLRKMKPLIEKGVLYPSKDENGQTEYRLQHFIFYLYRMPWWTGRDDEYMRRLATMTNRYFSEALVPEHNGYPTRAYRAIPIQAALEGQKTVTPYEDVVELLKTRQLLTVSQCSCKTRHNLDPHASNCKYPTEVCMHFDALGEFIIDAKAGRVISLDEAFDIVTRSNELGLIHGTPLPTAEFDTLCNCCKCCCLFLETTKAMPESPGHMPSNYISRQDDHCEACGTCEEMCPMDALKLDSENTLQFQAEKCIGCGVCAHHCPADNIKLAVRAKLNDYPETTRDFHLQDVQRNRARPIGIHFKIFTSLLIERKFHGFPVNEGLIHAFRTPAFIGTQAGIDSIPW
jgi:NAD-dependent dihydropyrimidine dehydrogenase PreA subunit